MLVSATAVSAVCKVPNHECRLHDMEPSVSTSSTVFAVLSALLTDFWCTVLQLKLGRVISPLKMARIGVCVWGRPRPRLTGALEISAGIDVSFQLMPVTSVGNKLLVQRVSRSLVQSLRLT